VQQNNDNGFMPLVFPPRNGASRHATGRSQIAALQMRIHQRYNRMPGPQGVKKLFGEKRPWD
jgi:hypothetical protein